MLSDRVLALSTNGTGASNVLLEVARGVVEGVVEVCGLGIAVSLYFYFQTFIRLIPRISDGWDTGIRTPTDRIKVCSATITPYPITNIHSNLESICARNGSGQLF